MSEKNKGYVIDGFLFWDEELAKKARQESDGIRYVRSKTNMEDPAMVLKVYNRIVGQRMFETPVGIGYMRELQEYLMSSAALPRDQIMPIPIQEMMEKDFGSKDRRKKKQGRQGWAASVAVNIVLGLAVVAMIVISVLSGPTIFNYENALIDKYAAWEQELSQREQAVSERERALNSAP